MELLLFHINCYIFALALSYCQCQVNYHFIYINGIIWIDIKASEVFDIKSIECFFDLWYNIRESEVFKLNTEEKKFDKVAYDNAFILKNYDRINLTVPKGFKEDLKAHADQHDGGSVNGFINRAIRETMERDAMKE